MDSLLFFAPLIHYKSIICSGDRTAMGENKASESGLVINLWPGVNWRGSWRRVILTLTGWGSQLGDRSTGHGLLPW